MVPGTASGPEQHTARTGHCSQASTNPPRLVRPNPELLGLGWVGKDVGLEKLGCKEAVATLRSFPVSDLL